MAINTDAAVSAVGDLAALRRDEKNYSRSIKKPRSDRGFQFFGLTIQIAIIKSR
jgi:hypothetical protein